MFFKRQGLFKESVWAPFFVPSFCFGKDPMDLNKITELAKEICERESLKLYDLEYLSGKGILRVYIDGATPEAGVSLDNCAEVSRSLSLELDVENLFTGPYNLEVSSPGLERALKTSEHYTGAKGKKALCVIHSDYTNSLYGGVKKLTGVIESNDEDNVTLKLDNETKVIPYEHIHKAQLIFEYGTKE